VAFPLLKDIFIIFGLAVAVAFGVSAVSVAVMVVCCCILKRG
jgi:hypothetical protein